MEAPQNTKRTKASEPTLKRLPRYLHYLQKAQDKGILTISAPVIGKELQCDPTQVVKDLATTGVKGRPRIGYNIHELIQTIESFLGYNRANEAFLVGAGNLGMAMMSYPDFQRFGLKIVAAFDTNRDKIGRSRSGINILHMNKFQDLARRLQVRIAVLTVPHTVAQEVTDLLVASGIEAIWNLTPSQLQVPEHVIVQNTSMYANVTLLLKKLQEKDESESVQ